MTPPGIGREPEGGARSSRLAAFLGELKQRQVFQSAGAYAVIAWGITEILDGVISRFGWPDWIATLVVVLFVVGFPVAMWLAWVFDWTPAGIRRDAPWTARNWVSATGAVLFLVAGSAGLFWLINPAGVVRVEQVGFAVLPCRYRGEPAYRFRAEGAAGVIHETLAQRAELRMPDWTSVRDLAARNLPTGELGRLAGADWLVECRLSQNEEHWRIDVSLVDAGSDNSELVVSRDFDITEFVDALDAVARSLVAPLGLPPAGADRRGVAQRYSPRVSSFDAYLQGEQSMSGGTAEDFGRAREHFRAAQQGPGFPLARVREADAFVLQLQAEAGPPRARVEATIRAAGLMLEAVEGKDPNLPELYAARMRLELVSVAQGAAEAPDQARQRGWYERALELRPSYAEPHKLLAQVMAQLGDEDEAAELLERARELRPAN